MADLNLDVIDVDLSELKPGSRYYQPRQSVRCRGFVESLTVETRTAVINFGGPTFTVDMQLLPEFSLRKGSIYEFMGELVTDPTCDQLKLQVRDARELDAARYERGRQLLLRLNKDRLDTSLDVQPSERVRQLKLPLETSVCKDGPDTSLDVERSERRRQLRLQFERFVSTLPKTVQRHRRESLLPRVTGTMGCQSSELQTRPTSIGVPVGWELIAIPALESSTDLDSGATPPVSGSYDVPSLPALPVHLDEGIPALESSTDLDTGAAPSASGSSDVPSLPALPVNLDEGTRRRTWAINITVLCTAIQNSVARIAYVHDRHYNSSFTMV